MRYLFLCFFLLGCPDDTDVDSDVDTDVDSDVDTDSDTDAEFDYWACLENCPSWRMEKDDYFLEQLAICRGDCNQADNIGEQMKSLCVTNWMLSTSQCWQDANIGIGGAQCNQSVNYSFCMCVSDYESDSFDPEYPDINCQ